MKKILKPGSIINTDLQVTDVLVTINDTKYIHLPMQAIMILILKSHQGYRLETMTI